MPLDTAMALIGWPRLMVCTWRGAAGFFVSSTTTEPVPSPV
jgi:hypothetical protein